MSYRSPIVSMQHELEELEARLSELLALPPPQPKRAPPLSKKARLEAGRETRSLQLQLARVEKRIAERSAKIGVRALTPREVANSLTMLRTGFGGIAIGVAILSIQLGLAASTRLTWTETTCSIRVEDDVHVASYVVGRKTYRFAPHAGDDPPNLVRCFVPVPPKDGVGRVDPPRSATVGLLDKLSLGWSIGGAISLVLGVTVLFANRHDRRKREQCEIEPDDFSSSD